MLNLLSWLLEQPLIKYAIALYFVWLIVIFISRVEKGRFTRNFMRNLSHKNGGESIEVFITFSYVLLTLILLYKGLISLFPYLNAAFLGIILWLLIKMRNYNGFLSTLLIILIPYMVVTIFNSYPLGDDARFTVSYAATIAREGMWIPYRYPENDYYQLFHAEPALAAILTFIMGLQLKDIKDIPIYYLTLKYTVSLLYTLGIYLLSYKLTKNRKASYISLLLFSITPPLSLTQIVTQGFSLALGLVALDLIIEPWHANRLALYLIIITLTLAGILFHITYVMLILVYLIPLMLIQSSLNKNSIKSVLVLVLLISINYLAFTYAAKAVFSSAIGGVKDLINFLLGVLKPYSIAPAWYFASSLTKFFVSWALLPSLAGSALTYELPKLFANKKYKDGLILFSIIGLFGIALNYLLRLATWLGGRYFYWLYLLVLPFVAYHLVTEFKDKTIATLTAAIIIAWAGIYGVQDFTHSANTFVPGIGWADNTSWSFSWTLSRYLPQNITIATDQRVGVTLGSIQFLKSLKLNSPKEGMPPQLLIIRRDDIGYNSLLQIESSIKVPSLIKRSQGIVLIYEQYIVYYYF